MTREEIEKIVTDALQKRANLRLTFKTTAIPDINYLLGMASHGCFRFFYPTDYVVMMAVADSKDWDGDDNRIVTLVPTEKFDMEWFVGRMTRAVERLELADPQTGRVF